jgi:hypothetical protein
MRGLSRLGPVALRRRISPVLPLSLEASRSAGLYGAPGKTQISRGGVKETYEKSFSVLKGKHSETVLLSFRRLAALCLLALRPCSFASPDFPGFAFIAGLFRNI